MQKKEVLSMSIIGKYFFLESNLDLFRKIVLLLILLTVFFKKNILSQTSTFNYTGTVQSWTVPANVCKIRIIARGAGGGGGGYDTDNMPGNGGNGARVEGEFSVNPGDVLNIYVGQGGRGGSGRVTGAGGGLGGWGYGNGGNGGSAGGNNPNNTEYYFSGGGGGGGGGTAVINSITNLPLIVAGGGGGGGGGGWNGPNGSGGGGNGSQTGVSGSAGGSGSNGGVGGGSLNNNGTNGGNHIGDGGGGGGGGGGYNGGTGGSPSTGHATNATTNKDENGGGGGGGSSYCSGTNCNYFNGGGASGGGCCSNYNGINGNNGNVEIIIIGYRPTISLTSAASTINQSVCINNSITNIVYSSNYGTGATFAGLPAGVTGNYNSSNGNITISGTPTTTGTFTYIVTVSNQYCQSTVTGTITVNPNKTITLTSASSTNSQIVCINTPITTISYSTSNATGATFTGLPPGVTGIYNPSNGNITINGTPTVAGVYNYTITPQGCGSATATGTITVTPNKTISLTSGSANQTVCVNTPITNIVYSTNFAINASVTGLPPGVTSTFSLASNGTGTLIISGTPTSSGTYNFTVTPVGCGNITATGTITVNPNRTITLSSGVGTNNQSICINSSINNITYTLTNSSNATITGLPPGVTGIYSSSSNTVTISGTPTSTGTFNYTVTPQGCGNATATGTITINDLPQVTLSYNTSVCESSPLLINTTTNASNPSYVWSGPNSYNNNTSSVNIPSAQLNQGGTYTVTVTNGVTGCSATSTASVAVNALPIINVTNNTPVCEGGNINLLANVSNVGISQYIWTYPNSTTQAGPNVNITNALPSHSGTYTVQVTSVDNCVSSTQTNVVVNPNPVINPTSNSPVCEGLTLNLNANGSGSGINYSWTGPMSFTATGNATSISNVQLGHTGTYIVTATNTATSCSSSGSVDVVVNPVPVLNPTSNSPVCENGTLQLNVNTVPNGNYTWSGPNVSGINQQNFSINPVSLFDGGTYTVSVVDMNGCFASATTSVIINALPSIQAFSNSPVCEEGTLNLFALSNSANASFAWIGPHGFSSSSPTPNINPTSILHNGIFSVTVTDVNTLCTNSTSINVVINPLPQSTITTSVDQLTKCEKESVMLSVIQDPIAVTYQWTGPGGATYNNSDWLLSNLNSNQSGTYTVTVTSNQGCTRSNTVNLTVNPKPMALFVVDRASGCSEHCMNFNDLSMVSGSAAITAWDWRNDGVGFSNSQNPNLCITNNGSTSRKYDIQLIVTSSDGCKDTLLMNDMIEVFPRPVANYVTEKFDYTVLDNILFKDQSVGNMNVISWNWDMGDGNAYTQPIITHSYADTGAYTVTLTTTNNYGCTSSVSYVYYINEVFTFYIPNSFTPNRDMKNDIWNIKGRGIKEFKMEIYNRWGERIYETDDYTLGWPGTYKTTNEKVQAGTYTYKIYVFDINNTEHNYIGHVNVIY